MLYARMVHAASEHLARELHLDERDEKKLRFGLEIFFSTCITFFCTMVPALLWGFPVVVMLIMAASALLKVVAGGVHLQTPLECAVFTAVVANLLALAVTGLEGIWSRYWSGMMILVLLVSLTFLYLWSPARVPGKSPSGAVKRRLKGISMVIAVILVSVAHLWHSLEGGASAGPPGILAGVVWHSLSILPLTYRLRDRYTTVKRFLLSATE